MRRILVHLVLAIILTFGVACALAWSQSRSLSWAPPVTIDQFDAEWFAAECPYDDVTYLSDISTSVRRISYAVGMPEETIRLDAPGYSVSITRRQLPTSAMRTYVQGVRYRSGWPLRCLGATRWTNGRDPDVRVAFGIELEGPPAGAMVARPFEEAIVPVMPLRPHVLPFLGNVVFWMWCTFTVHALFTNIMCRTRIQRRQCAACGHAIVCSECGAGAQAPRADGA